MAIAIDTSVHGTWNSVTNTTSWNHTVAAGTSRLMTVQLSMSTLNGTVSTVKFNSVSMTLAKDFAGNGGDIQIWYLVAPSTGTHSVTITWTTSAQQTGEGESASWTGVKPASPLNTTSSNQQTGTNPSITLFTSVDNALILANLEEISYSPGQATPDAFTRLQETANGSFEYYLTNAVAGTFVNSYTDAVSTGWSAIMASFAPDNSGTGTPSGVQVVSAKGTATATGTAVASPSGDSVTSAVGTVTTANGATAQPVGVQLTATVGTATISASSSTAAPTGLSLIASFGAPLSAGDGNSSPLGVSSITATGNVVGFSITNLLTLINGNFQDAGGNPLNGFTIEFTLQQDGLESIPLSPPGSVSAGSVIKYTAASNSNNMPPFSILWSNASVGGSYSVMLKNSSGVPVWRTPHIWTFTQAAGSTADLGTMP